MDDLGEEYDGQAKESVDLAEESDGHAGEFGDVKESDYQEEESDNSYQYSDGQRDALEVPEKDLGDNSPQVDYEDEAQHEKGKQGVSVSKMLMSSHLHAPIQHFS